MRVGTQEKICRLVELAGELQTRGFLVLAHLGFSQPVRPIGTVDSRLRVAHCYSIVGIHYDRLVPSRILSVQR